MALSRFITLTFFLTLSLFSSPIDFESCQLKYQASSLTTSTSQALAVDNGYVLFYSKNAPKSKLIRRDPFLGLNLMKSDKKFRHPFKFYRSAPKKLASVSSNKVREGKILHEQIGLNTLGEFSSKVDKNALISGPCCGLIALSTGNGLIDKAYLEHFLQVKEVIYGDLGIRLADKQGTRVVEINPFFENSPFLLDDVILFMDKKKTLNAAELSRDILFSKPGSKHFFLIVRNGKKIRFEATIIKRISGGLIHDSFFGLFGLELDEHLVVKKDNVNHEINKGDKLLFVMGKPVKTLAQIRQVLSLEKNSKNPLVILLFQREGFDFFIHFNKPNNSK